MGVKIELDKKECNTVANALLCYMKYHSDILKKDRQPNGKKLSKSLRVKIAEINERAGALHRFFLIVGK